MAKSSHFTKNKSMSNRISGGLPRSPLELEYESFGGVKINFTGEV
jgi:hypothetical protein